MTGAWIPYVLLLCMISVALGAIGSTVLLRRLRNTIYTGITVTKVVDAVMWLQRLCYIAGLIAGALTILLILTLSGVPLPEYLTFPAAVR